MHVAANSPSWLIVRLQPAYKWLLALVVAVVLLLGWRFPLLGFAVPVAMGAGMGGGLFRGRWVCGNLCPRGSLLDTWLGALPRRPVPEWLRHRAFRWAVLATLLGLMVAQIAVHPGDWRHWGLVFWRMCLVTTAAAVALAVTFTARGWCRICPVGTVAATVGGDKLPLRIGPSCRGCGHCEQSCPMHFDIAPYRRTGALPHRDCLKCSNCVKACPAQALSFTATAA